MTERGSWAGCAADLLRVGADRNRNAVIMGGPDWPKNPRALAGWLRRAQTFLRALGIEIAFSRKGRAGSRVIRMHATLEDTVRTVGDNGKRSGSRQPPPRMTDDVGAPSHRADPTGLASVMTAGDADGADAKL
jgi:hypothetical protein